MLETIEINPKEKPTLSVIWLHGLGADGHDFKDIPSMMNLEGSIRFVFPHAPIRPVTLNGDTPMRAWFDVLALEEEAELDEAGILMSEKSILALIEKEKQLGFKASQIILAGFSQGGAIALFTALRFPEPLAGVLALSTFCPFVTAQAESFTSANQALPIMMAHGLYDPILPLSWAEHSKKELLAKHYQVDWRTYAMAHSVSEQEIGDISDWFNQRLTVFENTHQANT